MSLKSWGCSDNIAGAPFFHHSPYTCISPLSPKSAPSPNHQPHLPLKPQPAMKLAQVFILVNLPQKQLFLCLLPRSSHHPPVFLFSSVFSSHGSIVLQPTKSHNTSQLREDARTCYNMTCILLVHFCPTHSLMKSRSE